MEIELTRIFVKVIQNGSFTKAAALLKLPKSTVSKAVTRLEQETGTKLLLRTTRSLTLTAAGRAFFDTCLGPVSILEDARKSLHGQDSILSGTIKITAPEDLGGHVISSAVGELTRKNPGLNFEMLFTDEIVDLVKDGFDLAVRIGKLRQTNFKARRLGEVRLILVASPAYLKQAGRPKHPRDLDNHSLLTISSAPLHSSWALRSNSGQVAKLNIRPKIIINQMTGIMRLAAAGAGIALVPGYLCKSRMDSGELVRVLPEWSGTGLPVSLVSPLSSASSARLKVTTEHLSAVIERELRLG